jgi:hypothetical protein
MENKFPEADWKIFRQLHPIACERYCNQAVADLQRILSQSSRPSGHRFWDALELAREQAKEIRSLFDDFRRSTALVQLIRMCAAKLIRDKEMSRFTDETCQTVERLLRGK